MTDSRKQYLRQQIVEKAGRVDEVAFPLIPLAGAALRVGGGMIARRAIASGAAAAARRVAATGARAAVRATVSGAKKSARFAKNLAKDAILPGSGGARSGVVGGAARVATGAAKKGAKAVDSASDELADVLKRQRQKKEREEAAKKAAEENQQDNYTVDNKVSEACWDGYTQKGMKTMFGKQYPNCVKKKRKLKENMENLSEEGLRAWFGKSKSKGGKPGWVQVVSGKPCARQPGQKSTPKCVSSSKRASMTPAERSSAQARKRRADPGQPQKSGAAKPTYVPTDKPKR